jgi:hypothetical protein
LLNPRAAQGVSVTIADRMAAWRRARRMLLRMPRVGWRPEWERAWALASARAERGLDPHVGGRGGTGSARVHQITAAADLDRLDAALGELRTGTCAPSGCPYELRGPPR